MNTIDTSGIEPLAHPMDIRARLRADEVTETDQRAHFQQNAPATEDGHYLVPKVIE
jgi:aspartyl-tRNA(Asn)/glutamyl-tRNA(Gln) amidotransferase subunit C